MRTYGRANGSNTADTAMSINNFVLASVAIAAFAAAVFVAARPEPQTVSFAMPMTSPADGARR